MLLLHGPISGPMISFLIATGVRAGEDDEMLPAIARACGMNTR